VNPKIKKVIDDIERTKAKIAELQVLLPELERKRIDMENTEIIKLIRSADISPAELPGFLASLKTPKAPAFVPATEQETFHAMADEAVNTSDILNDFDDDDVTSDD